MNVRHVIEFLKKPSSKLVIIMVLLFTGIVIVGPNISKLLYSNRGKDMHSSLEDKEYMSKTDIESWNPITFDTGDKNGLTEMSPRNDSPKQIKNTKKERVNENNNNKEDPPEITTIANSNNLNIPSPLNIYNESASKKKKLDKYLPYGQWIPCELAVTLQTSNSGTPIIGIVTENIYNAGKLIIPAGSYVHGTTAGMPMRDHIRTDEKWIIVWRTRDNNNGKELILKGVALENGSHWNGKNWDLLDGSAGIKGFTHDSRNISKLKDIAVGVVEGAGSGLQAAATLSALAPVGAATEGSTNLLNVAGEGLGGAISSGASRSASLMAKESLANVIESQYYVTAPAGTQFYLYVQQTVDFEDAQIAATSR
jgi:hypothetical protein